MQSLHKVIFLHIPKTAGTTLHDAIVEHLGSKTVCPHRFDTLRDLSVAELDKYCFFSGHYNRLSVDSVPGPKRVFTFLREPKARLLSLFYFWKSHDADFATKHNLRGPLLVQNMGLLEFLKYRKHGVPNNIDNIMTRTLMGKLRTIGGQPYYYGLKENECVEIAMNYLDSMAFVGFQDTFKPDAMRLCGILGYNIPEAAFDKRARAASTFSEIEYLKAIEREEITPEIDAELDRLTTLDRKLYRAAKAQFSISGYGG